jgi:RND family efflux transporter MFP subunit
LLGRIVCLETCRALARSAGFLIAARAVQGAGAGAAYPPPERGKALGIFSGLTGLALIAGPVVGGVVAEGIAWQWIFWINIPIGLIAIPLARGRIPESFGPGTAIDIPGVVLVTGAALGLVWGLMRGNTAGWSSLEVTAALVGALLLAIAFVAWELRAGAPMLPMRLFRSRAFSSGNAANFLYSASLYGTVFFIAQFLQTALGYGPLGAGLRLLPWTATLFVFAPIAGGLVNRIGERPLIVFGLILQAVGMAWIAVIAAPDLAYGTLVAPLIIAGAGVSVAMPAAQNAVLSSVAQTEIGKASGTFNMLRFLGGVSGIAIAAAVFAGNGSFGSPQVFSAGFAPAIGVSAVLSLLGAVAGMWQPAGDQPFWRKSGQAPEVSRMIPRSTHAARTKTRWRFLPMPDRWPARYRLSTMAASLVLVFGSSLPLNAQPKAPEVTVANPVLRRLAQWDEYTGQFEAVRRVEVRARVSGELVKIHFTDGQTVKAGEVLFTIDPRPFEIAVEAARAEVARARAQVAVTGNDLERAEQLTPSKVLTQRDFDQRKANHDAAKAQLQSADAMLRNAELNLKWTSVRAPIDRRISDRKVDAGNLVSGGQVGASLLTTIVSLHPIHFVFNVSEPDYVRYSRLAANGERPSSSVPGNAVQIRLADEKEWTRNGQMNFIDNQLNGKSGTIRARAVVENEDSFLTPGTFGRLRLFGGKVDALLIPDAAVVSDQSRKVVYTVGPDNKIQVKPVMLGPIEESLRVVTIGLSKDDRVVISGLANPAVRSGATVAPIPGNIVLATN